MHKTSLAPYGETMSNIKGIVSPLFSLFEVSSNYQKDKMCLFEYRINSHPSICNTVCPYCGIFYEGMQCPNCGEIERGEV
jgi:hypothetical protein